MTYPLFASLFAASFVAVPLYLYIAVRLAPGTIAGLSKHKAPGLFEGYLGLVVALMWPLYLPVKMLVASAKRRWVPSVEALEAENKRLDRLLNGETASPPEAKPRSHPVDITKRFPLKGAATFRHHEVRRLHMLTGDLARAVGQEVKGQRQDMDHLRKQVDHLSQQVASLKEQQRQNGRGVYS